MITEFLVLLGITSSEIIYINYTLAWFPNDILT